MKFSNSFRSRIFVTLVSIAVIPLIILLGLALPATRLFVIERFSNQLSIVADLKTAQVNQWLDQGQDVANLLVLNTEIIELLPHLQQPHFYDHPDAAAALMKLVSVQAEVTSASVLHPETGRVLLSSEENLLNRDWGYQDFFIEGKVGLHVGQVAYSLGREAPIIYVSRPLLDSSTQDVIGVIVVELNLGDLEISLLSRSGLGDTGHAYLVDKFGFYVTSPLDIDISPLSRIAESEGVQRVLKEENGVDNYLNPLGVPVLGVFRWLEQGEMGLLVEIENAELISSYRTIWIIIIAAELLLVLVAIITAKSMTNKLVGPLETIAAATEGLKAGDFSQRAPTDGPDEIAQLAESFNKMAVTLQGSYTELESVVKQRTLALEQSQAALSSILQTAPDAIISLDKDQKIILFNDAAESMFDCTQDQALGILVERFIPAKFHKQHAENLEQFAHADEKRSRKMNIDREVFARRWQGDEFPVETSISRVVAGENITLTVILRDITERIILDNEIKKSLDEKETLLKEIHHRIKNNLQIISSLLYLQSKTVSGEDSIRVLEESQSRIKSMALIHESLYQADDLSSINLSAYIRSLGNSLIKTYSQKSSNVVIDTNIADIPFNVDMALPLGLIINELISNSLKHGFPKNEKGIISIEMTVSENGKHTLIISDDGVGMPADIELDTTETLGLHLVKNLVSQLDGQITISRKKGTQFVITFDSV